MPEKTYYDVIIIGGGPAGLTAGLYTSRAKLDTLVIEREVIGGQVANIEAIENYPGFPDGVNGFELSQQMQKQAEKYGAVILYNQATALELKADGKKLIKTSDGDFEARAVILAGSAKRRKLGIPGEEEYTGRGVSFCATCDAPLFKDKPVAVAGGGNSAITEALHLARFASKVTVIHRRDQLRASPILQDRAFTEPKMKFLWDTLIQKVQGGDFVESLSLKNARTGQESVFKVEGLFVSIGFDPDTAFLKGIVTLDAEGHVITNTEMETNVPGIYAAGDIRVKLSRQIITAAGDGATAAMAAERFLSEQGHK